MASTAMVPLSVPPWLDEICTRLRSNDDSLTNLNLNIRRLTPFTLAYLCDSLKSNTQLTALNLVNSLVSPLELRPLRHGLANQMSLRVLHLSYNKLVDVSELGGILKTNSSLEEIFLNYNQIQSCSDSIDNNDSDGIIAMANALAYHNKSLKVLHLGKNHIDNRGALAFSNALRHNTTLKLLSLVWNKIDEGGIKALVEAMDQGNVTLHALELDRNPGATPDLLQKARELSLENQYGRYLLRSKKDLPHGLWPQILQSKDKSYAKNASRINFFLQSKPELCYCSRFRYGIGSDEDDDAPMDCNA